MVVTILKVEPGGWGAEKAMPASARISPLVGSSAAIPPKRPASPTTAASWTRGEIEVRTGSAWRGRARASTRRPGAQLAAGTPAQALLEGLLEATLPDRPVAREAERVQALALLGRLLGLHAARDRVGDADERRGARARRALGQHAPVAGEQRAALGRDAAAREPLAVAQLGEDEPRLPVDALLRDRHEQLARLAPEDARVDHDRHDHLAVALAARLLHLQLGLSGGVRGAPVAGAEALEWVGLLRIVAQERVHGAVVAALPGLGEVGGGALRGARRATTRPVRPRAARRPPARPGQAALDGSGGDVARRSARSRAEGDASDGRQR